MPTKKTKKKPNKKNPLRAKLLKYLPAGIIVLAVAITGMLVLDHSHAATVPLTLEWPLSGTNGHEWVVNNYLDQDTTTAIRDFTGATGSNAKTYDGHNGIDIDVPTFRATDANFPVLAAAAGTVTAVVDGNPDRNLTCSGNPNYITVKHSSGYYMQYLHMKSGAMKVVVGQTVTTGQQLGVVASSGCSSAPHLHFGLFDSAWKVVDPFQAAAWRVPPPYAAPLTLMDATLQSAALNSVNQIKDPPANVTYLDPGGTLGIGLSAANGKAGDIIKITYTQPNGTVYATNNYTLPTGNYRHSYWLFNRTLGTSQGAWTITISTGGVNQKSYSLQVGTTTTTSAKPHGH